MSRTLLLVLGLACVALQPISIRHAQAQEVSGPRMEITITDELVPVPGEQRTAQRDSTGSLITLPGDVIQYNINARNTGTQAAYEAEIVDPIPEGTEYVPDSAYGHEMIVTYSTDNDGNFFQPQPITYEYRTSDGTVENRPLLPEMYTHIKWLVNQPIPSGSSVVATFRVKVTTGDTARDTQ